MKLVEIILRYYLLALMLFPCADGEAMVQHDTASLVIASQDDGHNHSSAGDECSPLCVCHCCHIHYVVAQKSHIQFVPQYFKEYKDFRKEYYDIHIFDFLKPPKVLFS